MAPCAPWRVVANAPAVHARDSASTTGSPRPRSTANDPQNASPAPTVLTTSTAGGSARATSRPRLNATAPRDPSVTTRRPWNSASCSAIAVCSPWLAMTTSARASTVGGTGREGATLSTNKPLAWRAASMTAESGISSWLRTTSHAPMSVSTTWTWWLVPDATLIRFSPMASIMTSATPVLSPSSTETADRSTPSRRRLSSAASPNASSPTAATRRTSAPARLAARA